LINSKLLRLKDEEINKAQGINLKTINGVKKTNGMVKIKIKILEMEENVN